MIVVRFLFAPPPPRPGGMEGASYATARYIFLQHTSLKFQHLQGTFKYDDSK